MTIDSRLLAEAYATQMPVASPVTTSPSIGSPATTQSKPFTTPQHSQNNQETAKSSLKDWIRLPYIDTPFKARMAAVLVIELINTMVKDSNMRELVFKELRANNRLQKKFK
jgi:hypothetical protein